MKNVLWLVLMCFFVINFKLYSQTVKILFDASKAETAGNADWILDADLHNIGFGSGPAVVGQGSESNPAVVPTPAQSGISSGTSETYWDGALSYWGIDCVNQGYIVNTLPYNGQITYGSMSNPQDLSNYKVFVVCEPNILFTASEKMAMMNFIQNGGGLYIISDHDVSDRNNDGYDSPAIWNDFFTNNGIQSDPFGVSIDLQNFSQTTTNIPSLPGDSLLHGPFGNVTKAMWSGGTSLTLNPAHNSTVKGVVYKTGSSFGNTNVLCAYAHYGSGKVAVIGDSSPFDDGTGDANDVLYDGYITDASGNHRKLIMNTTIWLATSYLSGINTNDMEYVKAKIYPNPVTAGSIELTYSLKNNSSVDIEIFDVTGNVVKEISLKNQSEGFHQEKITGRNFGSGLYICKFSDGNSSQSIRFVIYNPGK